MVRRLVGVLEVRDVPGWELVVRALNTQPEYVASTTLADPAWSGTTVLSGDVAAAVRELKAKPGGELQVHGSGALTRWLLENDLVDEMTLDRRHQAPPEVRAERIAEIELVKDGHK